jgi:hypothetical protein
VNRSTVLLAIALGLAGYGIYAALYVPAMLVGPSTPLLLVCFVLQVVSALVAAAGMAREQPWASTAIAVFAASVVATQFIEVLLGILPYVRAVFVSVVTIVLAIVVVAVLQRRPLPTLSPPP